MRFHTRDSFRVYILSTLPQAEKVSVPNGNDGSRLVELLTMVIRVTT